MIIRYGTRKYNYGIGISQKTKFNEQQSVTTRWPAQCQLTLCQQLPTWAKNLELDNYTFSYYKDRKKEQNHRVI